MTLWKVIGHGFNEDDSESAAAFRHRGKPPPGLSPRASTLGQPFPQHMGLCLGDLGAKMKGVPGNKEFIVST